MHFSNLTRLEMCPQKWATTSSLPSQNKLQVTNPIDASDRAFAELFELFSEPSKTSQKAYRRYSLTFENGEPIFTLCWADRFLDEIFEEMFGPRPD